MMTFVFHFSSKEKMRERKHKARFKSTWTLGQHALSPFEASTILSLTCPYCTLPANSLSLISPLLVNSKFTS